MEKLAIIDYSTASIHIYDIDPEIDIDESYIESLGFNIDECYWMFGETINIIHHKELLK